MSDSFKALSRPASPADIAERVRKYREEATRRRLHLDQGITQTELKMVHDLEHLAAELLSDLKARFRNGAKVEDGDFWFTRVHGRLVLKKRKRLPEAEEEFDV